MTDLIHQLEAWALQDEIMDADSVNASFSAPFAGMKEMYALSKGIEHGFGVALDLLAPVIEAAVEAQKMAGRDDVNGYAGEVMKEALADLRAKLGET